MGDDCLDIVTKGYAEYEYLEKMSLNLNRNDISSDGIIGVVEDFEGLGMLNHLVIEAKKNIRKVDEKDEVRTTLNKLMVKHKKIYL